MPWIKVHEFAIDSSDDVGVEFAQALTQPPRDIYVSYEPSVLVPASWTLAGYAGLWYGIQGKVVLLPAVPVYIFQNAPTVLPADWIAKRPDNSTYGWGVVVWTTNYAPAGKFVVHENDEAFWSKIH